MVIYKCKSLLFSNPLKWSLNLLYLLCPSLLSTHKHTHTQNHTNQQGCNQHIHFNTNPLFMPLYQKFSFIPPEEKNQIKKRVRTIKNAEITISSLTKYIFLFIPLSNSYFFTASVLTARSKDSSLSCSLLKSFENCCFEIIFRDSISQ